MRHVPPELNQPVPGKVLLVGRDPGEEEEKQGRPFVGLSGDEVETAMAPAGLRRQDVNITNVVPFRPPENNFKAHDPATVAKGIDSLKALQRQLKPALTIALGNEASYALVPDWPTAGRDIYGAKGIEDRRGYFWDTPDGWVLTTLHPAGVLRKPVPGGHLLRTDFQRARRWLRGELAREEFPSARPLFSRAQAQSFLAKRHNFVATDIEGTDSLTCIGFCGDDFVPYVCMPMDYEVAAKPILESDVNLVAHNGQFDLYALEKFYGTKVKLAHDTLLAWYALEPELAGRSDSGGEGRDGKLTRKGLAFLASMYTNVAWWKNYPKPEDPDFHSRIVQLNANDVWITRKLISILLRRIAVEDVQYQYRQAMSLIPVCVDIQHQGLTVDNALREQRISALTDRIDEQEGKAREAGLAYIEQQEVAHFRKERRCTCCGGGAVNREHCWRCAGLPTQPKRKEDYPGAGKGVTVAQLREKFPKCNTCQGSGKTVSYEFNPFSPEQMKVLLYEELRTPKATWKGKTTVDESAMKAVLRWAK